MIFEEEHHFYQIDCNKAVWATDELNDLYKHNVACLLTDADWIIETENDGVLIVEYKNGTVFPSKNPFNPNSEEKIRSVAHKYYDTLHYLTIKGKRMPARYYYILEYPNSDRVTSGLVRNKIAKLLPFQLQNAIEGSQKIIESFEVLSIDEWNAKFPNFPITRTNTPFKEAT